ncbi:MAG: hypothetical protein JW928_03055 [Candidatus Aureabacteria bacterium]|nr:hypothetical protein [Candidatus Auribacterota bacterium]
MKIFFSILIESSEYFTLIAGACGMALFIIMLLTLDFLREIGKLFNRQYSVKDIEKTINKRTDIEHFVYARSKILGIAIFLASFYVLVFLIFNLDLEKILSLINIKQTLRPFVLALIQTAKLFTILSITFSIFFGIVLIFDRSSAEKMSNFFNSWYSTEELEEKLDETILKDTDTICFLHNRLIGCLGFLASLFLFGMALFNLLSR